MDANEAKDICIAPWNMFRIQEHGDCYICTTAFKKNYESLGNIFTQSFDEIWNGEMAQKIRQDIVDEKYTYCRTELCNSGFHSNCVEKMQFKYPDLQNPGHADYPNTIFFAFDYSCKQKCVFCRDAVSMLSEEESKKWSDVFEEKLFPVIKNVKTITLNCIGEFLDGPYSKELIRKIININPDIKFEIITNAISFTKQNIEELDLSDKINAVRISLHCTSKSTYKKIFRKDNFDTVMKNLEFIKSLKDSNKIQELELMFVICSLNYKEMKDFVKLANKLNARASFSLVNKTGARYLDNEEEFAVFQPNHHLYNDFVRKIKDPIFGKYPIGMPNYVKELGPVSPFRIIKNYINYIKMKMKKK